MMLRYFWHDDKNDTGTHYPGWCSIYPFLELYYHEYSFAVMMYKYTTSGEFNRWPDDDYFNVPDVHELEGAHSYLIYWVISR